MSRVNLYTSEGWLDMPSLDKVPGIWLVVIVGARQIGKTYGLLKMLMTSEDRNFIYMRRTQEEVDFIMQNEDISPFAALEQDNIRTFCVKNRKLYLVGTKKNEEFLTKGSVLSLSSVAKMRGFSGNQYTDIFYDEFIPEKMVIKRNGEGDALLNAYTTINGNRELNGYPPVKLWLAANAFDQENPVLEKFGLINTLAKMKRRKEEMSIINGSCLLIRPLSEEITDAHRKTAMNAFLEKQGTAREYLGTAVENTFSYDSTDMIRPRPLHGHKPLCRAGQVYIYTNGTSLYVCTSRHNKRGYGESNTEKIKCQVDFPIIRMLYNLSLIHI